MYNDRYSNTPEGKDENGFDNTGFISPQDSLDDLKQENPDVSKQDLLDDLMSAKENEKNDSVISSSGEYRIPHYSPEKFSNDYNEIEQITPSIGSYVDEEPKYTAYSQPNYNYNNNDKNNRKKKSNGTMLKTAAIAVVCSLVFGTAGGYLGSTLAGSDSNNTGTSVNVNKVESTAAPDDTTVTNAAVVTGETLTASQIYELATQQVVSITAEGTTTDYFGQTGTVQSMGTGFVISDDGYIATNYHVISSSVSGGNITVSFKNGESYPATIVGGYEAGDVALLKIEATGLSAATLGDSNDITVGEDIYVIGNALGEYDYTLTGGLVSGLDRTMTFTSETSNSTETINMFQIDAAVNSGNSGGPVYNSQGEIVGIVTSKVSSSSLTSSASVEGLGFAIPINDAYSIINDILTKGYVEGNVLIGVSVQTVQDSYGIIPSGVYVSTVNTGSAAESAGIQEKDIITKLDDTEIASASDLKTALKNYSVGDSAKLTIYRSNEYIELTVTFTETENTSASTTTDSSQQDESQQYPDGSYGSTDDYGNSGGYGGTDGSGNSGGYGGIFG